MPPVYQALFEEFFRCSFPYVGYYDNIVHEINSLIHTVSGEAMFESGYS